MPGRRTLRLTELDGLRNLPQKFHSAFYIGAEKEKETNLGTRAKTRQSAAQTSIRADARAGIFTGSSSHLGLDKKKTNIGTRAKTRQSAAQTSIRAAVRAGIFTGSSSHLGLDKKKTNIGTRAKTRQSAAQTSIRAAARAGIIQWRICPVARRHEAEYQRRYGAFWRRVRIRRCALGKLTVMVVPLSGPLSTSIFPPCALTIAWIIVIPKPCPSVFVV